MPRAKPDPRLELLRDLWDRELIERVDIERIISWAADETTKPATINSRAFIEGRRRLGDLGDAYITVFRTVVIGLRATRKQLGEAAFQPHVATLRAMAAEEEVQ